MQRRRLPVKLILPDAIAPVYATKGSAGLDLYAPEEALIHAGNLHRVDIGIAMAIPEGYGGLICSRSGYALQGLRVEAGVIDSDYRGSISVLLRNANKETDVVVRKGSACAQMLILPIEQCQVILTDDLDATERGEGGFGSTDAKQPQQRDKSPKRSSSPEKTSQPTWGYVPQ